MLPCILRPADHPIRARESISVLRLMPKVRRTAALVAPPSSAAHHRRRKLFAIDRNGAPLRRPRRPAAARPAVTRSWVKDRSNCARAPKTWNCPVVAARHRAGTARALLGGFLRLPYHCVLALSAYATKMGSSLVLARLDESLSDHGRLLLTTCQQCDDSSLTVVPPQTVHSLLTYC